MEREERKRMIEVCREMLDKELEGGRKEKRKGLQERMKNTRISLLR